MSGRPRKLDPATVQRVDQWFEARPSYYKHIKTLAGELGVSLNTLLDARHRRRAYEGVPRGQTLSS